MDEFFKIPPKSPRNLTRATELPEILKELIDLDFGLTGKTRTDGANLRKLIAKQLLKNGLPEGAMVGSFEIVPPKRKGMPKIIRELIDTYIVTSGDSYNLQVWNRIPASNSLLIKYESGESLKCLDVRFVFVKIDMQLFKVSSIVILTPDYIELKFGKFGKPTIKFQLLISSKARKKICENEERILSFPDTKRLSYFITHDYTPPRSGMLEEPEISNLYSINLLKKLIAERLIGQTLNSASTKNRGQSLERKVLELLGYSMNENGFLCGGFPDIRNQLLEVKVQDSPTVDLGKFSPENEEIVIPDKNITTFDVRYLIALTNPKTNIIEGIILAPGEKLGEIFTYVSDVSYKCQRSIPMNYFNIYKGKCVFNP